jgi:hypothetical protein
MAGTNWITAIERLRPEMDCGWSELISDESSLAMDRGLIRIVTGY